MRRTVVSIVRVDDVPGSVERAVELAGGLGVKEEDVVVIKPHSTKSEGYKSRFCMRDPS